MPDAIEEKVDVAAIAQITMEVSVNEFEVHLYVIMYSNIEMESSICSFTFYIP